MESCAAHQPRGLLTAAFQPPRSLRPLKDAFTQEATPQLSLPTRRLGPGGGRSPLSRPAPRPGDTHIREGKISMRSLPDMVAAAAERARSGCHLRGRRSRDAALRPAAEGGVSQGAPRRRRVGARAVEAGERTPRRQRGHRGRQSRERRAGPLGRRQVTAAPPAPRGLLSPPATRPRWSGSVRAREGCGVAEAGPGRLGPDGARGTGGAPRGSARRLRAPRRETAALPGRLPWPRRRPRALPPSPRLSPVAASATLRPREEASQKSVSFRRLLCDRAGLKLRLSISSGVGRS